MQKRGQLTGFLPGVFCTPEMEQRIRAIAKREKTSVAEVTRTAYLSFLAEYDSNHIINESKAITSPSGG